MVSVYKAMILLNHSLIDLLPILLVISLVKFDATNIGEFYLSRVFWKFQIIASQARCAILEYQEIDNRYLNFKLFIVMLF